jgi:phage tail sheath gpL-like
MLSTAVDLSRISRVVGYKVYPANFEVITPYLPQRVVILGEANTAYQENLDETPFAFINAKQVGEKYGYGSPLHQMARILRPLSGDPIGGIPTIAIAQPEDDGATAGIYELGVTVATTVTKNATHKLYINGRDNIDGQYYSFTVPEDGDAGDVIDAIIDAVNGVMGSPVVASDGTTKVILTSKWKGATAVLNCRVETFGEGAGIVYAESSNTAGTGDAEIDDALATFGDNWNTLVVNAYGEAVFDVIELFNGVPDPQNPSGRYTPTSFKPALFFFGSVLGVKEDIELITNDAARIDQVSNVHCPAPNSEGFPWEAAANVVLICAITAQNYPHLDVGGQKYLDMPVPTDEDIGDFANYTGRDYLVKVGSSTVSLSAGKYMIQDLITTYAPEGDPTPKFRPVRDIIVDWNVAYNVLLLMQIYIQDKAIVPDNTPTKVSNTIKPKGVKQLFNELFSNLEGLALLADQSFSADNLQVGINEVNPARLDVAFKYKRTSTAHIVSTDAAVDFNYST